MTQIIFKLSTSSSLYYFNKYEHMTIDMIVRKYVALPQNDTSYPKIVLYKIKGYINGVEINIERSFIDVLSDDYEKNNLLTIIHSYIIKTEELSEQQMKRPVIDYLIKHNIIQACWTCEGKPFNVWEECFDSEEEIIEHYKHQDKVCDKKNCDLITNYIFLTHWSKTIRNEQYKFRYDDIEFEMEVPLICKKSTIIETFLKNKFIKNLITYDFDLYYVKYSYTDIFNWSQYKNIKLNDNDKFVVKDYSVIGNAQISAINSKGIYVIVRKNVTSYDLYKQLNQLPRLISDIICTYADFNSNSPICDNIFKLTKQNEFIYHQRCRYNFS